MSAGTALALGALHVTRPLEPLFQQKDIAKVLAKTGKLRPFAETAIQLAPFEIPIIAHETKEYGFGPALLASTGRVGTISKVPRIVRAGKEIHIKSRLPADERIAFEQALKTTRLTEGQQAKIQEGTKLKEIQRVKAIAPEVKQLKKEFPDLVDFGSGAGTGQLPYKYIIPERITISEPLQPKTVGPRS